MIKFDNLRTIKYKRSSNGSKAFGLGVNYSKRMLVGGFKRRSGIALYTLEATIGSYIFAIIWDVEWQRTR